MIGEEEPGRLIESANLDEYAKARLLHGTVLEWLQLSQEGFE
jgi:hypothetical protein